MAVTCDSADAESSSYWWTTVSGTLTVGTTNVATELAALSAQAGCGCFTMPRLKNDNSSSYNALIPYIY